MSVPTIRFLRHRKVPREYSRRFREYWKSVGDNLLESIIRYTGLTWKKEKISVHMKPEDPGGILGWIEPSESYDITVHLANDSRINISTLAHELVHSNIWSNYMNDLRWKDMALFEDVFADELLTEVIAQKTCIKMNIGGRRRIDFSWAIQYAFVTTFQRVGEIIGLQLPENLGPLERRWGVDRRTQQHGLRSFRGTTKEELINWSRVYFREVNRGNTNAIEAHGKVVKIIPSLSDYLGKEFYFR